MFSARFSAKNVQEFSGEGEIKVTSKSPTNAASTSRQEPTSGLTTELDTNKYALNEVMKLIGFLRLTFRGPF